MKLEEMSWPEVDAYLMHSDGVILPVGSIEQHGPIGLIGTDAICAREIAWGAGELCRAIVAPELSYAPAPFNMRFPGTVSISPGLLRSLATEIIAALTEHGFRHVYVLNGHGANLAALRGIETGARIRLRSWWDFDAVNALRRDWYGDWEGMHATPSEVSITRATTRTIEDPNLAPPEKLSPAYIAAHAGDRHGPPDDHRRAFPDGRVGSHSGLARAGHGAVLLQAAAQAVADDFRDFVN